MAGKTQGGKMPVVLPQIAIRIVDKKPRPAPPKPKGSGK